MKVTLYKSPTCPKCRIVMQKLTAKNIEYVLVDDVDAVLAAGIKTVPTLDVDGTKYIDIRACNDWINAQEAN